MDYRVSSTPWSQTQRSSARPPGGEQLLLAMQSRREMSSYRLAGDPTTSPPQLHHVPWNLSTITTTPAPQILVIDDSATVRRIIEVCHYREGFVVQVFSDGVAALQWLARSQTVLPPLVYLDIEMPRLDGYQVARALRARSDFGQTTLVMLSGRDSVLDRLKGRLVGAHMYLTKPFRTQELLAISRSFLLRGQAGTENNDVFS